MTRFHLFLFYACLTATLFGCQEEKEPPVTDLVDLFACETQGERVSPITHIPFGNIQFSPNVAEGNRMLAFAYACHCETDTSTPQTIRLMPITRPVSESATSSLPATRWQTAITPTKESAAPGYYSVTLDNGVCMDFSLTKHCGMHSFSFPKGQSYGMLLDIAPASSEEKIINTSLWKASNRTLQGYRKMRTPAGIKEIYFCLEFSQNVEIWTGERLQQKLSNGQEILGTNTLAWLDFGNTTNVILVKTGLSLQTDAEAFTFLQTELPHWSFDKVKREASQTWRKLLSRVRIKSEDTPALQEFYTALYHAYPIPLLYFDIRESYKNTDGELEDIYQYLQKQAKPEAERVFSALGLRPDPNNHTRYLLSCPQFSRIVLRLEQDRRFVIKTDKEHEQSTHMESVLLNGKPLQRAWLTKEEVVRGGTLEFSFTDE